MRLLSCVVCLVAAPPCDILVGLGCSAAWPLTCHALDPQNRCLVELSEALKGRKTVVMLVGNSDGRGGFVPNDSMTDNLIFMMDVTQASASVKADKVRILEQIKNGVGAPALNQMAIGACMCAVYAMSQRAVLRAAFGDTSLLHELRGQQNLGEALLGSAAGSLFGILSITKVICVSAPGGNG